MSANNDRSNKVIITNVKYEDDSPQTILKQMEKVK